MSGTSIDALIEEAGRQYNVDPRLIRSVMHVESGGRPDAEGPTIEFGPDRGQRARGLMQLSPSIIRAYGVRNPNDPRESIMAGARLLSENLDRFNDPVMAVRAYHGGPDQRNWGPQNQQHFDRVVQAYQNPQAVYTSAPGAPAQAPTAPAAGGTSPSDVDVTVTAQRPSREDVDRLIFGDRPLLTPSQMGTPEQRDRMNNLLTYGNADGRRHRPAPSFGDALGAGVVRGMRDVLDLPAEGLAYLGDRSGATDLINRNVVQPVSRTFGMEVPQVPTYVQQAQDNQTTRRDFEDQYGDSGAALTGRVMGNVAGITPAMSAMRPFIAGMGTIAGAAAPSGVTSAVTPVVQAMSGATTPANPLLRFGARAAGGAVEGAASQALMLDRDQPIASQLAQGAGFGAAGRAVIAPALNAAGRAVAAPFRLSTRPDDALLARRAEQLGVPIRGSQISQNPVTRLTDRALLAVPGSGHAARTADQAPAFTRAVARSMGANSDTLDAATFETASRNIGRALDQVAARVPTYNSDAAFTTAMNAVRNDMRMTLGDDAARPLQNLMQHIDDLLSRNNSGGDTYQALTRYNAPLGRLARSSDPNVSYYAKHIREALDDLLERVAPSDVVPRLREARSQWRSMHVLERSVDDHGNINVGKLWREVTRSYGNPNVRTSNNDLSHLALIGRRFLSMPGSSNTTEYDRIRRILEWVGGGGLASTGMMAMYSPGLAMAQGGAIVGAGASANMLSRYFNSDGFRRRMIEQGLNPTNGNSMSRFFDRTVVPGTVAAGDQDWNPPIHEYEVTAPRLPRR